MRGWPRCYSGVSVTNALLSNATRRAPWTASCVRGASFSAATRPTCRLKSRASVPCAVPDATPMATSTWARHHAPAGCDLQGDALRRRRVGAGAGAQGVARVARRRRAARPVPRARPHPAATRGRRSLHAARDERGAAHPRRWAACAACRWSSRSTGSSRSTMRAAPRHLRPHPPAHRGAFDHCALHGHAPAGAARWLPRGVRAPVVGARHRPANLVQPLHAADG